MTAVAATTRLVQWPLAVSVVVRSILVVEAVGVRFLADHLEILVQLYVYLATIVQADLDFVIAILVADFSLGDSAAAGELEGGGAGLVECITGDGRVAITFARRDHDACAATHDGDGKDSEDDCPTDDPSGIAIHCFTSFHCYRPVPGYRTELVWAASPAALKTVLATGIKIE